MLEPSEIGIEAPVAPQVIRENYPASRIISGHHFGYIFIPRSCLHHPRPGAGREDIDNSLPAPVNGLDFVQTVKTVAQT